MRRLREIAGGKTRRDGRRGYSRQRSSRRADGTVRRSCLRVTKWLAVRGHSEEAAVTRIGLVPRTVRSWEERWREDRLKPRARGRPVDRPDRDLRNAILSMFGQTGPDVTVEALREWFPDASRAELRDLKRRYRRVWRRRNAKFVNALRWLEPGSVWAIDFTRPPRPVDGIFDRVLVVRDLTSGRQLEALPTIGENGQVARDVLVALILAHGAPLVLKMDNGPAFQADETRELLAKHAILPLYSPPYTPSYNGAVETGIGTLKVHTHYEAARNDRPGEWTCDDVEGGRQRGNHFSRPFGATGPSPEAAWSRKMEIGEVRRRRFLEVYEERRKAEEKRLGILPLVGPSRREKDKIDRIAISQALIDCGFLFDPEAANYSAHPCSKSGRHFVRVTPT